ncbi:MAG: penicillin acylase family protein [Armatimonadetes bacterium]|nr:penicillin acylase family protein [Armatimonadota bacterium]MDE2205230.1 penicillin acylase family protein [Armatimonadota bacterium]
MLSKRTLVTVAAATGLLLSAPRQLRAQTTIYRDALGLPSVVAPDIPAAFYGLGYAVAQDDAVQMERNFLFARGRLAEVDGQKSLMQDIFIRTMGFQHAAVIEAPKLRGIGAAMIDSFCAGANLSLRRQRKRLPHWLRPVTRVDVLALSQLMNAAFALEDVQQQLYPGIGSNQFAIAPARTAQGHALLSIDPHLPWSGIFAWYEFSLYTPEFWFHGVTVPGVAATVIGHTANVGWSMTNNSPRLYDLFTIHTNPDNPNQYRFRGVWKPYITRAVTLHYLVDGKEQTSHQLVRSTAWGPIAPLRATAVHLSMLNDWKALTEPLAMDRAKNALEFRRALAIDGISMWNMVYADTHGNIGYQYNARVPHRSPLVSWTPAVDGANPNAVWGPLWTVDQLPHILNPESGLLVNANSDPKLTPCDGELKGVWPRDVTSYGETTRRARLAQLLMSNHKVTVRQAMAIATDTYVPYAIPTVAALAAAGRNDASIGSALAVLHGWNGRADITDRGTALFYYWCRACPGSMALRQLAGRHVAWTPEQRRTAVAALRRAGGELIADHGSLSVPWGAVHVAVRGSDTFPVSGFRTGDAGAAVVPNFGPFVDGRELCDTGSSFRMIVSMEPHNVESWAILPHGESQDPASPHFADQNRLFGEGRYVSTNFGPARARKAAVEVTRLPAAR